MRRLLSPVPIAVLCALVALEALLAYRLSESEPDRRFEESLRSGERNPAPALELPRLSPLQQRWHERMELLMEQA